MFALASICAGINLVFVLFLAYRRFCLPSSAPRVSGPSKAPTLSTTVVPRQPQPLPPETLDYIFSLYITSLVDGLQCETVRDYRIQKNRLMRELSVVAQCSRRFQWVVLDCLGRMWASCGQGLCSQGANANAAGRLARCVWIITAEQGCLPLDTDLSVHTKLEIASVNYHDGVEWSKAQQIFRRFRCIRAYPRSLRQLEILRLHTPEEEVIRLVSDCCPGLTELRLVRCTMFNDPKCWYWRTHTRNQDHDYMKDCDPDFVVTYANHMALLLRGLQQLESVHIGHYLISINAAYTHRLDDAHKQHHHITDRTQHIDRLTVFNYAQLLASMGDGPIVDPSTMRLADRELWANSCLHCERDFRGPIEIAERLAAGIIAAHLKSLKHVSFANFLSDKRICPSSWLVGRQLRGEDLHVRTEDPNRPRSRLMQEMVRVGNRWEPPRAI